MTPGKRPIAAISIAGLTPGAPPTEPPVSMMVKPTDLLVDEAYQRNLSERSLRLIRRMVEGWDWRRFKPPVTSWTDDGLVVLDGQHTAIAAASHPAIAEIPIVVVETADQRAQASAFIGHNRDRLAVTQVQLHIASVAAGDEEAMIIARVCASAGVEIVPAAPKETRPGQTMAVTAIRALVRQRGEEYAEAALSAAVEAGIAPLTAVHIKAVDHLLGSEEFDGQIDAERLVATIQATAAITDAEARVFAATHCTPMWKALAAVWFKHRRKKPMAKGPILKPEAAFHPLGDDDAAAPAAESAHRPGPFMRRCAGCDETFKGAKDCSICADCAEATAEVIPG
jgi:hypothetical protein